MSPQPSKAIVNTVAVWNDGNETRKVFVGDFWDFDIWEDGKVIGVRHMRYVRPCSFNSYRDPESYYHGFCVDPSTLSEICIHYTDGSKEYLDDPKIQDEPIKLVVEEDAEVFA